MSEMSGNGKRQSRSRSHSLCLPTVGITNHNCTRTQTYITNKLTQTYWFYNGNSFLCLKSTWFITYALDLTLTDLQRTSYTGSKHKPNPCRSSCSESLKVLQLPSTLLINRHLKGGGSDADVGTRPIKDQKCSFQHETFRVRNTNPQKKVNNSL